MITFRGTVIKGENIGEGMGYPTANFSRRVLTNTGITRGVYFASVDISGTVYRAVLIVGVPGKEIQKRDGKVELYILNFNGRLYGRRVEVSVYKKLRQIKKFSTEVELIDQIKKDISEASTLPLS